MLTQHIQIAAICNGQQIPAEQIINSLPAFEGKSLDELSLNNVLITSRKECEQMIAYLNVHKFCFNAIKSDFSIQQDVAVEGNIL